MAPEVLTWRRRTGTLARVDRWERAGARRSPAETRHKSTAGVPAARPAHAHRRAPGQTLPARPGRPSGGGARPDLLLHLAAQGLRLGRALAGRPAARRPRRA